MLIGTHLIATIIPELITDLQNASEKLPVSYGDKYGRATQIAALGFKAKIELYYACWNKNGWPELEGFEPSSSVAQTYYAAAASRLQQSNQQLWLDNLW